MTFQSSYLAILHVYIFSFSFFSVYKYTDNHNYLLNKNSDFFTELQAYILQSWVFFIAFLEHFLFCGRNTLSQIVKFLTIQTSTCKLQLYISQLYLYLFLNPYFPVTFYIFLSGVKTGFHSEAYIRQKKCISLDKTVKLKCKKKNNTKFHQISFYWL